MLIGVVYGQNIASDMPGRYSLFPFRFQGGRAVNATPAVRCASQDARKR